MTRASFSPTHQTLHRHQKSLPTAFCCLTLSGYRCHRTDKDGLLTTCSTVISFKVSIQVRQPLAQQPTGGGLLGEGLPVTVLCGGTDGVIWKELVRGHGQKGMLMANRSYTPRSCQSQNKYSGEDPCSPTPVKSLNWF